MNNRSDSDQPTICISINTLGIGGAEKQSLLLAEALRPHLRVIMVIIKPDLIPERHLNILQEQDITYFQLSGHIARRMRDFTRILKAEKVDLIFSFLPTDTLLAAICGRLAKTPFVMGGIRNAQMSQVKTWVMRWIHNSKLLDYSISNTYQGKRYFTASGFRPEKLLVLPNGIKLRSQAVDRPLDKSRLIITTLARFVEQKDYETAIRAIARLRALLKPDGSGFTFRIIGYGPQQQHIEQWLEEYQIQDITELYIRPNNIPTLLEQSTIYLSSSLFEGLSNSILEAMEHQLPIVATKVGDNDQLIADGENGFLVETRNAEALAEAMKCLIDNPALRKKMGENSLSLLRAQYSFESFRDRYLHFIAQLLTDYRLESPVERTKIPDLVHEKGV